MYTYVRFFSMCFVNIRNVPQRELCVSMNRLQWNARFSSRFGPLQTFLESEQPCLVLACDHQLLKVDSEASITSLRAALTAFNGRATGQQLVSLAVSHGGNVHMPFLQYESEVKTGLVGHRTTRSLEDIGLFVLRLIETLPQAGGVRHALLRIVLTPFQELLAEDEALNAVDVLKSCARLVCVQRGHTEDYVSVLQTVASISTALPGDHTSNTVLLEENILKATQLYKELVKSAECLSLPPTRPVASVFPPGVRRVKNLTTAPTPTADDATDAISVSKEGKATIATVSHDASAVCETSADAPDTGAPSPQADPDATGIDCEAFVREISSKQMAGAKHFQSGLRAINKLADDSFSQNTHFVKEIIQNADDNAYAPGVVPQLQMSVHDDYIVIRNNEAGFAPENVRALCDVDGSTKKGNEAHIGEHGLGFKSVFLVAQSAEIHSRGFHFRLDTENKVVPHWIPRGQRSLKGLDKNGDTCIVLRLNEHSQEDIHGIFRRIYTFSSVSLLFLNQLRSIIVEGHLSSADSAFLALGRPDAGRQHVRKLSRTDINEELVELNDITGVDRWFVCRETFSMDKKRRQAVVKETEMVMAIFLSRTTRSGDTERPTMECPVCTFLPIMQYGFKCAIHASFILTASREGIREDDLWNMELRDHIPRLFVRAFERVKKLHGTSSMPELSISDLLSIVPLDADFVNKFFKPVARRVHQLLTQMECLPVEWCDPGSNVTQWMKPAMVAVGK